MASKSQRQTRQLKRNADSVDIPSSFEFTGTCEIQAGEGDSAPRFKMVAYDGGVMRPPGFPMPVVVDLAGMSARWWDYWHEYWEKRDTDRALPKDVACEITIPLNRFVAILLCANISLA